MKAHVYTHVRFFSSLALALALAIWLPVQTQSAEPATEKMKTDVNTKADGKTMECCRPMMEQRQKMMAEMKAQDAELERQVAKMNSAPEAQKTALLAAIVTRMVEQRTAMHEKMAKMGDDMMKHMMEHMQKGDKSMPERPMMKGMDEKPAESPKGNQTETK